MNILVLSDLHFNGHLFHDRYFPTEWRNILLRQIPSLPEMDLVVIAGDVVENTVMDIANRNPLETLYHIFQCDVAFCLGNHEFANRKHADVLAYWKQWEHPHVHCLDVEGHYVKGNYNIVGNVLWYDWSLNENSLVMKGEIHPGWLDATIKEFNALDEHERCKQQIYDNLTYEDGKMNILLTHMVPHHDLNAFSYDQPYSPFNAYSGVKNFIQELLDHNVKLEYAICGHTHRRAMKEISGVYCINLGNDYYFKTKKVEHMVLKDEP